MSRTFGPCGEVVVQSGGGEIVDSISLGNQAPSGSTGELFNISVPSDRRLVITGLMPDSAAQAGISITFGVREIYNGSLSDSSTTGALTVSQATGLSTTNEYTGASTIHRLDGDYGEDLIITKTSGTTNAVIYLSYKLVI